MKKLFALLAVCAFALTFVACGGQRTEESAETETTETVAPAEEAEESEDMDTTTESDTTAVD